MTIKNNIIQKSIFIGIAILSVYYIFVSYTSSKKTENFEGCDNISSVNDMPESAAEACKKISTRADEIRAHYGGATKFIESLPILSLFNPKSYSAGDNTNESMARNIVKNNLSTCELEKIYNTCQNEVVAYQENTLDNTACKYCENNLCTISGNVQRNVNQAVQRCDIALAIKALTEKKNSVDAQALAKVLASTEGILSGSNISQIENCNIINQDLSSTSYLDTKNECLNKVSSTQVNTIKGCGAVLNNIQENSAIALQECMIGASLDKVNALESENKVSAEAEADLKSKGIDPAIMSALSAVSLLIVVMGGIMIVPSLLSSSDN